MRPARSGATRETTYPPKLVIATVAAPARESVMSSTLSPLVVFPNAFLSMRVPACAVIAAPRQRIDVRPKRARRRMHRQQVM
jgi:hypothetical protein